MRKNPESTNNFQYERKPIISLFLPFQKFREIDVRKNQFIIIFPENQNFCILHHVENFVKTVNLTKILHFSISFSKLFLFLFFHFFQICLVSLVLLITEKIITIAAHAKPWSQAKGYEVYWVARALMFVYQQTKGKAKFFLKSFPFCLRRSTSPWLKSLGGQIDLKVRATWFWHQKFRLTSFSCFNRSVSNDPTVWLSFNLLLMGNSSKNLPCESQTPF